MLTHKQVKKINRRRRRFWGRHAPKLIKARTTKDAHAIGIHLLTPNEAEIQTAFCEAQDSLFPAIYIHTKRTFGRGAS